MSDIAIKVEDVSKKFSQSIKHTMFYGATDLGRVFLGLKHNEKGLRKGEFWANKDINFEVKKGESLGLVGGNGAGKSTMLKMLNGIFMPDKGYIAINGKVGALIEVGAGFHPMLTGRENVYVNGSILGMNKSEIDRKLDAIIDFADIEKFIDAPVKHYSSGMYVRLGFAIAVHCRPEILLIDEVLAVGDANFQRKCLDYLLDLRKNGVTFIIVTHSMQTIEAIAKIGILFHKGEMLSYGESGKIVAQYELMMRNNSNLEMTESINSENSIGTQADTLQLVKRYTDFGTNDVNIDNIRLLDSNNENRKQFDSDEQMSIEVLLSVKEPLENIKLWLSFINEFDVVCLGSRHIVNLKEGKQVIRIYFNEIQLTTGRYKMALHFFDETFTNPFSQGHYGYFEVLKKIPSLHPGINTPYCWTKPKIEIEGC